MRVTVAEKAPAPPVDVTLNLEGVDSAQFTSSAMQQRALLFEVRVLYTASTHTLCKYV